MRKNKAYLSLGVDIGSVSLSFVLINLRNKIVHSGYHFHFGNIRNCLRENFSSLPWPLIMAAGFNQSAAELFKTGVPVNDQIALIEGIKSGHQDVRSLFTIGGEEFGLILFNENYQYHKYISNSSCAAGTGSFLDQQAERLGLASSAELCRLAGNYHGDPPKIATRCAVFAKTDLIHCQQQGTSLSAICAGLCRGLAHNISDALLGGISLYPPVFVVGGVSKNTKVLSYLSEIIGHPLSIPENSLLTSAIGCALVAREQADRKSVPLTPGLEELLRDKKKSRTYFFKPLQLKYTKFPDFSGHDHYINDQVEVDLYTAIKNGKELPVYLGLDIGSTSTKAILMSANGLSADIIAGFYTRTRGQPVAAVQSLFRQIREIERINEIRFKVQGCGTTGSGRKFIQSVVNADMVLDEITAHARAACLLNGKTDTIIEIGGQDSKFTVVKDGNVTFSVMNYVCAAGTGSFIEEQARRLGIKLEAYADLAMRPYAPLTSDRCTVFMERDINHFLSQGYTKEELLAATLHSVRDNYLAKVAHLNKIGEVICFQGATAKNAALVSAFEQKLEKPIFVSRYCHLTGALGVCLFMKEKNLTESRFRGLDFYKETIAVEEEICERCNNNCKLNRITIGAEKINWGYLCGRDETGKTPYQVERKEFDLLRSRRRIFTVQSGAGSSVGPDDSTDGSARGIEIDLSLSRLRENLEINLLSLRHKIFTITQDDPFNKTHRSEIKIGLPETIYMQEYLPFWHYLFKNLGFRIIRAPIKRDFVSSGRELSSAEFCAPIFSWHGNISYLADKADYIFAPQMFEEEAGHHKKNFCYYSNYAVSIIQNLQVQSFSDKIIAPVIDFSRSPTENIQQIYDNLPPELKLSLSPGEIQHVYHEAWQWYTNQKRLLLEIYKKQRVQTGDLAVVLLGRPYLVMDPELNKNIPKKFHELGVTTYFQDMLPWTESAPGPVSSIFLEWNHWKYGLEILRAAEYIGQHYGLYPVFLTAFKCSPDSFLLHYFKEIMNYYDRPYLILQIDEHGSDVGYETRIESVVSTFRHHYQGGPSCPVHQKTFQIHRFPYYPDVVLIPNYDTLSCSLICAAFEKAGYKPFLIEESATTVTSSLRLNDGQCLPISTIVQGALETIRKHHLKPEKTALFLNTITNLACNFPQYPIMAKKILEDMGSGYEKVQIFASEFEMTEFSTEIISDVYLGYLLGGLLRKIGCRIRPYERVAGRTDEIIEEAGQLLYKATVLKKSRLDLFGRILGNFASVPLKETIGKKPKVSIIGDLYVRDNDILNQQLIRELENDGAEVVTTPFTFILRLLAFKHKNALKEDHQYISLMKFRLMIEYLEKIERRYYKIAETVMRERFPVLDEKIFDKLAGYGLTPDHGGETAQNMLKIFSLIGHYPDLSLFIHVNPIFCCPGLVSESIFKKVENDIGIPIVSITYDGTATRRNDILAPYIHYLRKSYPAPA